MPARGTRSDTEPQTEPGRVDPGILADERYQAQQSFVSEQQKQKQEPHFWVTFNRNGETDQVPNVHIGAAGVTYNIRKGERVPLPLSALNVMKMAVREGFDYGHPIERGGKKYLRKIKESEYSYVVEGPCSPEEAAEWNDIQKRAEAKMSDLVQVGPDVSDDDYVEVGTI